MIKKIIEKTRTDYISIIIENKTYDIDIVKLYPIIIEKFEPKKVFLENEIKKLQTEFNQIVTTIATLKISLNTNDLEKLEED